MVFDTCSSYLLRYLDQETAKWPLWSSSQASTCYLSNTQRWRHPVQPFKGRGTPLLQCSTQEPISELSGLISTLSI